MQALNIAQLYQNMQQQIAAATWRIEMKSDSAFCQITLVPGAC